jgi:hypothetical protein
MSTIQTSERARPWCSAKERSRAMTCARGAGGLVAEWPGFGRAPRVDLLRGRRGGAARASAAAAAPARASTRSTRETSRHSARAP